MKRELGRTFFREPQIIFQRAACDSQPADWPPLAAIYFTVSPNFHSRHGLHCAYIL